MFSSKNSLINHSQDIDSSKDFKLNNQKFLFTYRICLDGYELIDQLQKNTKIKPIYIISANEKKDKFHRYRHVHVLLDFGKRIHKRNGKEFFNIKVENKISISPYIQIIKSVAHWEECIYYIAKYDVKFFSIAGNLADNLMQDFNTLKLTDYQVRNIEQKLAMINYYLSQNECTSFIYKRNKKTKQIFKDFEPSESE